MVSGSTETRARNGTEGTFGHALFRGNQAIDAASPFGSVIDGRRIVIAPRRSVGAVGAAGNSSCGRSSFHCQWLQLLEKRRLWHESGDVSLNKVEPYIEGRDFLYRNDADRILFRSRMATISLTVLLALLMFATAKEMFGTVAALVALAFIVFEPNILAHGGLATIDAGFSCFMLAAIYTFYRYTKVPTVLRLTTAGVAFGLALASKHTGVFIGPILVLLAACELVPSSGPSAEDTTERKRGTRALLAILLGCIVSFAVLSRLCSLTLGTSAGLKAAGQFTVMLALPVLGFKALFELLDDSRASEATRSKESITLAGLLWLCCRLV